MNTRRNVTPLPQYGQKLGNLRCADDYWGENGALEYARRHEDLVQLTNVGLISLRYSAATSAWVRWQRNPLAFWWLWRFIVCFCPAFFAAREQAETLSALTADQCSVVGAVLARGGLRDLARRVFERGIEQNTSFEIEALLYAELYELKHMNIENVWAFVWGLTHAPRTFEEAKKPCGKISPEQLARVLRKIGRLDWAAKLAQESGSKDQVLKAQGS